MGKIDALFPYFFPFPSPVLEELPFAFFLQIFFSALPAGRGDAWHPGSINTVSGIFVHCGPSHCTAA